MKILPDAPDTATETAISPAVRSAAPKAGAGNPQPASVEKSSQGEDRKAAQPVQQADTNVTFRRDNNGRIYYVLTDTKSGKELQELPPEQVRSVGQGIEEYLQQEAKNKQSAHVEVKA